MRNEPTSVSDVAGPGDVQGGSSGSDAPGSVGSRRQKPVIARIARVVVAGALVVLCVVVVWWWAIGGRWLIVRTPSMGTYAPVGTLVWVRPVNIHDLHVGDVITFHTPTITESATAGRTTLIRVPSITYTHRVVAVDSGGTVQTKGDLNAARDPWHTDQAHLVGQVMAAWPGFGWLVGAFPLLLPGVIGWWVLTGLLASRRSRAPLRVLGTAGLFALAIYIYEPLFGADQLSFVPVSNTASKATYVGTGLMPVKLKAHGAQPVVVHTGEERSIVAGNRVHGGRARVQVVPTIPWQIWPVIAAACFAPAVWSVMAGVEESPPRGERRKGRKPGTAPMGPQVQTT